MFQKRKFATRVLGFLFLSCRLISSVSATAAEALPQCSGSTYTDGNEDVNCSSASYYCTKTTGSNTTILKLIAEDSTAYCEEIKATSVNVFEVTKTTGASPEYTTVKVDLSGSTDPTDAEKLVIYSCNGTTCTREYGHIRVNNNYYTVGSTASKALNGSGYFLLTGASSDSFVSCELAATTGYPSTCTAVQTMTAGYFKNSEGDYYKCNGSTYEKMEVSGTAKTSCSGTGDFGSLINTASGFQFCLDNASNMIEFASDSTALHYMFSIGATSLFASTATANSYILLEVTDTSITKVADAAGYYIADTDLALLAEANEGTLYSCSSGTCTIPTIAAKDVGYYKNADTTVPYIKCYQDSDTPSFKCESIVAPADTVTCGSSTIGQLVKDGKFCLDGSKEATFETNAGDSKIYQVSYSTDSIFASTVTEEGKFGIVEVTNNSIKILSTISGSNIPCVTPNTLVVTTDAATCATGTEECKGFSGGTCYYICNVTDGTNCLPKSYYILKNDNSALLNAVDTAGNLYYCETPGSACVAVTDKTGYFVNSDLANKGTVPYIECADSSGTIACKGITAPTGSTCENTTYGTLIIDSTVVKLCLDGTNKVAFGDSDTAKNYLVSYSSANIYNDVIVEEGKYGVVSVNNHAMIINTAFQTDYGICTNTGEVTSGLTSATGSCTTGSKSTTVDFCYGGVCFLKCKVTDGTNCSATTYYLVKDATTSIPVMSSSETGKLYYCKTASAACTAVDDVGYYLNGEKDAYACEKDANNALACKKFSIGSGCTADTIGQPIIDTNKIYFCLNYDASKASNQDTKSGEMTTNMDTNYLLGYKESNIFGLTAAGQYGLVSVKEKTVTLVRKDGKCIEDSTNLNTLAAATNSGKLYQCTAGICSVVPDSDTTLAVGYYKNIGAADTSTTDPEYIAFTTTSTTNNGVTTTTKSYKAIKAGSSCSAIGDIIVESSDFKICLTTSIKVKLDPEGSENGKYFIEVTGANIVFIQNDANNCHAIVIVDNENVYLSGKETDVDRYRYSDDNQKLLDFSEQAVQNAQCNANKELTGTLTEFLLMEESEGDTTNYYEKQS